jgi:hypothetical protein
MVLLASGSAVPADCRVNEGEIEVDEAALTGESLPVTMFRGLYCMDVCMYVSRAADRDLTDMNVCMYVCMYTCELLICLPWRMRSICM